LTSKFDIASLCALYDRGRLIPFIGSGMSSPACASWSRLVSGLERKAKIAFPAEAKNFIRRAAAALQVLRQQGENVAQAVLDSTYLEARNIHSAADPGARVNVLAVGMHDQLRMICISAPSLPRNSTFRELWALGGALREVLEL